MNNPRVSVTLKPKTAAVLRRLSAVTGNSISSIVGDLLEDSEVVLNRAAATIETGAKAMAVARARLAAEQAATQKAIQTQFFGLDDSYFSDDRLEVLTHADPVQRRATRPGRTTYLTGGSQKFAAPRSTDAESAAEPSQQGQGTSDGGV